MDNRTLYPDHRRDVDWPGVITLIGLPDARIAELLAAYGLKMSRVSVTELRSGKGVEPRYSVGCALLDLARCEPQDAPALQDRKPAHKARR